MSKLCHLALSWDPEWADIATRSELVSLRDLHLDSINSYGFPTIRQMLTALKTNSLRNLYLQGHIDEALFNTVLDQHGTSLHCLSLLPFPDYDGYEDEDNPPAPPFVLTPALSARLAEKCPNLELLEICMNRTQGDAHECAMYRGLGSLPRLRRLSLTLWFTIDINEEAFEDGEFAGYAEDIPREDLSRSFANAAIEAGLARSIFDLLSPPGSSLQHLQLVTQHMTGRHPRGWYDNDHRFHLLLRWLARSWICERRKRGHGARTVEIREHESRGTVEAGKEWQSLAEASKYFHGEEVFIQAFGDVWPQTTPRWWEDWTSLPLCLDGVPA